MTFHNPWGQSQLSMSEAKKETTTDLDVLVISFATSIDQIYFHLNSLHP
jgi:hypothetical protein